MQWTGEGLIIGVRRHGESAVIAELMVPGRGRHLGLVRGGRGPRLAATLQVGNQVQATWRARLEEHLGTFSLELIAARAAALIAERTKLYAAQMLFEYLRLLPERDPHDELYHTVLGLIDSEKSANLLGVELARFELVLLDELGFGLDIFSCAVSGKTDGLTHVSPKTGRAVTAAVAEPYKDKLLRLPSFFVEPCDAGPAELGDAFRLTGHFLDKHVWTARNIAPPATRERLTELLCTPVY